MTSSRRLNRKWVPGGKTALLLEAEPESRHGLTVLVFDAAMEARNSEAQTEAPDGLNKFLQV